MYGARHCAAPCGTANTVHGLTDAANGLGPTGMLLNACPYGLADLVPSVSDGTSIDRAATPSALVTRNMRRDIARPAVRYQVARVIGLVGAKRLAMAARRAVEQLQRIDPFFHSIVSAQ
jgi:hypothetical protein